MESWLFSSVCRPLTMVIGVPQNVTIHSHLVSLLLSPNYSNRSARMWPYILILFHYSSMQTGNRSATECDHTFSSCFVIFQCRLVIGVPQNVTIHSHLVSLQTMIKDMQECDPSCFISLECRIRPNYSKKCARMWPCVLIRMWPILFH